VREFACPAADRRSVWFSDGDELAVAKDGVVTVMNAAGEVLGRASTGFEEVVAVAVSSYRLVVRGRDKPGGKPSTLAYALPGGIALDEGWARRSRSQPPDPRDDEEVALPWENVIEMAREYGGLRKVESGFERSGHRRACAIASSPDSSLGAAGGPSGDIRIVTLWNGQKRAAFRGHTTEVTALAFTRDDTLLASGGADLTIKLWKWY
jgi:hypothetical protein